MPMAAFTLQWLEKFKVSTILPFTEKIFQHLFRTNGLHSLSTCCLPGTKVNGLNA